MNDIQQIALLLIGVVRFFIIVHFIMSWLINFQVLNIRQPFVYQVWSGLNRLMEPIYAPIRSVLPQMGGIDLSPLVALIGLEILRILII
ncbi:MAG: YggT family protein [Alphaproteobacteria bacterium]|jgi:YggT family protein|nr:YggT family protein [Alphaproteobacteria bacterium]